MISILFTTALLLHTHKKLNEYFFQTENGGRITNSSEFKAMQVSHQSRATRWDPALLLDRQY